MRIAEIDNPFQQFIAFIKERDAIRMRKAGYFPWPWTDEEILQSYRFTNVHREDDAVSLHYQKIIRSRYRDHSLILPATVFYRWFNRISTCEAFFVNPLNKNTSVFEDYIMEDNLQVLVDCLNQIPTPHVTGAFIITGKPGYPKGEGVLQYIHTWCHKPWESIWHEWQSNTPKLGDVYNWVKSEGLGSFMRGQIVADLKYLPFLRKAKDWWTFAAPGPGSMRGLNIVLGRDINKSWDLADWLSALDDLSIQVNPIVQETSIGRLHNQDLQNCLCEFSKFTKVARGIGRPRQVYRVA